MMHLPNHLLSWQVGKYQGSHAEIDANGCLVQVAYYHLFLFSGRQADRCDSV